MDRKCYVWLGCDISLFDDCLYFKPYASIGSYHKTGIPFLKGDKAPRAACCMVLLAGAAKIVNAYTRLLVQSTIDSFTERAVDAA